MTGIERKALYVLAMTTGLRADEIRSLTVGAVDFDNQKICLKAAHTKNSKDAALPLRPDVLDDLRLLTQGKLPGAPLFRHITDKTAAMLRKDMLDARADYLIEKYPDEKERIKAAKNDCFLVPDTDAGEIDFHSLRHTFGTLLAQSGVHPKTAQTLMRHSSIDLTMNIYTHSTRSAETAAINQLPGFEQKKQHKQQG
jgi:integrase